MKSVLIDIMLGNSYKGQLKFTGRGFPELVDGNIVEVYDTEEIRRFIEEKKPSLKGKDYRIYFSDQRV